ncbi:type IV toxin-antitoxin system AbiEi family antitoxin domain-containing protein [Phycicoccus sp. CSK15P-2]|uniref:type IV toxin-antitoxin system AbiEi family antitoxin domain-containing protein n=1 Tax=Phycicoccus sp. CSK15P-2 TaxID=2807627 RepID=UPI0019501834|nr:type IV toxin-antitoxin system AbiEi family antitoxin domain-containing protein [Phycicoccus sp. CSK15P-2]MBM6404567.1 type IV toxin-antitoxin system AbiEi family antitoxin domain-containing protein [Phycicoccus sp. CSK15P-2]
MPDLVADTLRRLGGCATWAELRGSHSERALRRARSAGEVLRVARGRYVVPEVEEHRSLAAARTATLSHLSAAVTHGWKVKTVPDDAWVTVRRKRHLRSRDLVGIVPHWQDLTAREVEDGVTAPLRTVLDCARVLPFDSALAVADSALRSGTVGRADLVDSAAHTRGPGARDLRRVARHADGRAANPFESVLRALAIEVGLDLTPQLVVTEPGLFAIVDLGSEKLRLALEADGYATHGTRAGLRKDCRRHTELAVYAWASLRYTYWDVMDDQTWVRWTLQSWLDVHEGRAPSAPPHRRHEQAEAA